MTAAAFASASLLQGVTVVNAGRGFAAAMASKLLADLGAEVLGIESSAHAVAADIYPAYEALTAHERKTGASSLLDLAGRADLCITGGEDLPGVPEDACVAQHALAAHPRLIVLDIEGYPPGTVGNGRPAIDILVQARSGLTYEHYTDRANLMTFLPSLYGAALQGVLGALAALYARGDEGRGQVVSTSLLEGALSWVTTWNAATQPDAGFLFNTPMNPRPLILKCADNAYIHIVLGSANAKYALYQLLEIEDPSVKPGDSGAPNRNDPPDQFYGDVDRVAPHVARWKRDELIVALTEAGVVGAPVQAPGVAWNDSQVLHDKLVIPTADGGRIVGGCIRTTTPGQVVGPEQNPERALPLEGVRMLDFGAFTAGPLAAMLLGKLGADVIKIEPVKGDPARNLPRAFMAANKGKRSIALDMKAPGGRALVEQLCATADVVGSNFRTGVSAKLGIDGPNLLARHPRMIVFEGPAFGQTGPRAAEAAFDLVLQALCGFEVRAGGIGNTPIWNRTFLADYGGGTLAAIGIVAALCHRQRTGRGATVEASLLSTAMFLQSETIQRSDGAFEGSAMLNETQTGFHPAECLYKASDGWLAIAVRDEAAARGLGDVLAVDLDADWRSWGQAQSTAIADQVRSRSLVELTAALVSAGVPAEICAPAMETPTFEDPDLLALGVTERVEHALYGQVSQFGAFHRFSRSHHARPARAPFLGEHSRDVLSELGVDSDGQAKLLAQGVVFAA